MNRGKRRSAPVEPTDLTSRTNGDAPKRIRLQAHRKFAEGVPIPGRQCSESFVRPVDVDYFPKNARCSALSGGDVLAANSPENSRDADALDIIAPSAEAFCAYILYDGES
ncbi:unnamed protein product [Notodromas monacha]|uniref:Uncharacterized protein n=1 Tax=Notodromas monacha TaxID=399045 RepID=A0A7R9GLU7_9CRUS|nr:unnamed protein product [Notodromas monacha]CAG0925381.1 unnamed protein product [Notodromas monacha]